MRECVHVGVGSYVRCDWTKSFLVSGVAEILLNYSICWITSNQNEAFLFDADGIWLGAFYLQRKMEK